MIIKLTNPVGKFIAMGTAFIPKSVDLSPDISPTNTDQTQAFIAARDMAVFQLSNMDGEIFRAHEDLAKSSSLESGVKAKILEGKNAQQALKETGDAIATRFDNMDDPYFKERGADIRDICRRIMANLKGVSLSAFGDINEDSIIIARELVPSDTSQMDFGLVKGFITELGGTTSHTCIIAANRGIPAAVGQEGILSDVKSGDFIILDGIKGEAHINPSTVVRKDYADKILAASEEKTAITAKAHLPAVTADGKKISVFANVGSIADTKGAMEAGAEGIGLFRTEFLYMESRGFPSEDEQFEVYKECTMICGDKPLTIRVLDIGGDKDLPYYSFPKEENPFLGRRGIRLCLHMKDMFKVQLRALLRASAFGNVQILYPMIISVEEYQAANAILQECKDELAAEGTCFNPNILTGIMVETPASALIAEDLALVADFISIGTNDLTQYILAVDRGNEAIACLYDSFHSGVLKAIEMTINAGHKHNKHVGMCGEFAANEDATQLLLSMGLEEFSVSISVVPSLKERLRGLNSLVR